MVGFHYKMRARNMANTAYVTWIVDDAADSAGLHAPELILPGSASVVTAWTDDVVLQVSGNESFTMAQTSITGTVAPDPGADLSFIVVSGWDPGGVINLPPSPLTGGRVTVKDRGESDASPIVVSGNGKTIQGRATDTLSIPFTSRTYLFGSVEWTIV
jgi:hypothetical protein